MKIWYFSIRSGLGLATDLGFPSITRLCILPVTVREVPEAFKLETLTRKIQFLKGELAIVANASQKFELQERISDAQSRIDAISARLEKINQECGELEIKITKVEEKIEQIEEIVLNDAVIRTKLSVVGDRGRNQT